VCQLNAVGGFARSGRADDDVCVWFGYTAHMLKFLIPGAGIALLLFLSGVIEVQIHPDKLSSLPSTVIGRTSGNNAVFDQLRKATTTAKRKGELFFAGNELRKLELTLGYIEEDAIVLQQAIAEGEMPSTVIARAGMLLANIQEAREIAAEVSGGDLVAMREQSAYAMQQAY
jgi:hypothetical protein